MCGPILFNKSGHRRSRNQIGSTSSTYNKYVSISWMNKLIKRLLIFTHQSVPLSPGLSQYRKGDSGRGRTHSQ